MQFFSRFKLRNQYTREHRQIALSRFLLFRWCSILKSELDFGCNASSEAYSRRLLLYTWRCFSLKLNKTLALKSIALAPITIVIPCTRSINCCSPFSQAPRKVHSYAVEINVGHSGAYELLLRPLAFFLLWDPISAFHPSRCFVPNIKIINLMTLPLLSRPSRSN